MRGQFCLHFPWDCQKNHSIEMAVAWHKVKKQTSFSSVPHPSPHFCYCPKPLMRNCHIPTVSSSDAVRLNQESLVCCLGRLQIPLDDPVSFYRLVAGIWCCVWFSFVLKDTEEIFECFRIPYSSLGSFQKGFIGK